MKEDIAKIYFRGVNIAFTGRRSQKKTGGVAVPEGQASRTFTRN
jgi:hypothetical protein